MIPEEFLDEYRNLARKLDQDQQWALGKLLELILTLDARVNALEQEIRSGG
jgi:hypothetical protein